MQKQLEAAHAERLALVSIVSVDRSMDLNWIGLACLKATADVLANADPQPWNYVLLVLFAVPERNLGYTDEKLRQEGNF